MLLDDSGFKQEVMKLCQDKGYTVENSPISGIQGTDFTIRKDDRITIVQCKAYKDAAEQAIVEDVFDSIIAYAADNAIVVCTEGFTRDAKEFARGKPILLLSARDIAQILEGMEWKATRTPNRRLTCPAPDCSSRMVLLRTPPGRKIYGCSRHPHCRGTREIGED